MNLLELKDICFKYGKNTIVNELNLEVQKGEILTVIGPSGCGKSTFLRLIAELEKPKWGEINFNKYKNENNRLRLLFQDYDAFPWYTTWKNVKMSATEDNLPTDDEVNDILKEVGIWDSRDKYPKELSGGMRKRLALARCLVTKPSILLLDEPFSALDIDTQQEMYALLQKLWQKHKQTIIIITHDLHEAILLGTRILISKPLPFEVYKLINIPFEYPRTDSITNEIKYLEIIRGLRESLRLVNSKIVGKE